MGKLEVPVVRFSVGRVVHTVAWFFSGRKSSVSGESVRVFKFPPKN